MLTLFAGLASTIFPLILIGEWIVDFLYDDRYILAGLILVTLTSMNILQIAQTPYQYAVLGLGHGRDYFLLLTSNAIFVVACIWIGLANYGLLGAILGQGAAFLLFYPIVVYFALKTKVFDPIYDLCMFAIAGSAAGLAWWLYSDRIVELIVR